MKAKAIGAVAVVLLAGGVAMGQTHAPWPTDWNNWNDPALWVTVGNPGNAGELSGQNAGGYGPDRICGAVAYTYNIGKYEVTAGQYTEFLNHVAGVDTYSLYSPDMWSSTYGCKIERYAGSGIPADPYQYRVAADWANRPVNYVTWGDAVRFANWLTNGQPAGAQGSVTTEDGSYHLNGAMTNQALMAVVVPGAAQRAAWSSGEKPYFLLPSEDEWYKGAYYDPATSSYYDYPTSSNSMPGQDTTEVTNPGNNADYYNYGDTIGSPYYRTPVGEFELSSSPYGTFDQGGNLSEWNESTVYGQYRGLRGGAFGGIYAKYTNYEYMKASTRGGYYPDYDSSNRDGDYGFRMSVVPDPATLALLAVGGLAMLRRRRCPAEKRPEPPASVFSMQFSRQLPLAHRRLAL